MTEAAAEKPKKEKAKKERKVGVGDVAMQAIREGKSNEEALAAVRERFPEAKTSLASINWYRNKLRADGEKVPTSRELRKEAKGQKEEALVDDPLA